MLGRRPRSPEAGDGRKRMGNRGEDLAARYLQKNGYKILERNFRCFCGEADIIALDRGILAVVEVKTRSNKSFGPAKEAVTRKKQRTLSKVALFYQKTAKGKYPRARFDVVAIDENSEPRVTLVKNAFELRYGR
ncbi:MAG: YraN family protein [Thermodesulfobacteriota bacterium]